MKGRKLLSKIAVPTTEILKDEFGKLPKKYDLPLYLLFFGDSNMMSFMSGVIANIPVNILIGLLTFTVDRTPVGISVVILMLFLLVMASGVTAQAIALTLTVIEIKDKSSYGEYKESRNNKKMELCFEKISKTYRRLVLLIVLSCISIFGFIAMFVLSNI